MQAVKDDEGINNHELFLPIKPKNNSNDWPCQWCNSGTFILEETNICLIGLFRLT